MTQWNIPKPVEIPWEGSDGGLKMWQVSEDDAWRFTYLVLQRPETGKWCSNLSDGRDYDRQDQAVHEVELHFNACINRCLCSRPLESFIRGMSQDLEDILGRSAARELIEDLCDLAKGQASFHVRELPWRMTAEGNMITTGGDEFPWPFISLVQSSDTGWQAEGGPAHKSSDAACADAQEAFNIRIEQLTTGPLEHRMKEHILEAARWGADRCRMVFEDTYFFTDDVDTSPDDRIEP